MHAWRSASPAGLARLADPAGGQDDAFIWNACTAPGRLVVAARGAHHLARARAARVTAMLQAGGVELHCLGVTSCTPSRLAAAARPVPWLPLARACGAAVSA